MVFSSLLLEDLMNIYNEEATTKRADSLENLLNCMQLVESRRQVYH